jgi:hypothetical protein
VSDRMTLERWILLISAVVAAVAPFLPIPELQKALGYPVPLWSVLVVGCVAALIGVGRFSAVSYGLKIDSSTPILGDKPNEYALTGSYKSLPPGNEIWLIVASLNKQAYWPQGEVSIDRAKKTWQGKVGLGSTTKDEKMRVVLAMLGKSGQLVVNYYQATRDKENTDKKKALPALPDDVIEIDSVELAKLASQTAAKAT